MSTYPPTVIFSIDDPSDQRIEDFHAWLVKHELTSKVKAMIGCYKGQEEPSFIASQDVFRLYVQEHGWVDKQESFLFVTGCNKAYATLFYRAERRSVPLGSMQQVSEEVARSHDAWTWDFTYNNWYICADGNPDHSREIKPANQM